MHAVCVGLLVSVTCYNQCKVEPDFGQRETVVNDRLWYINPLCKLSNYQAGNGNGGFLFSGGNTIRLTLVLSHFMNIRKNVFVKMCS